MVELQPVITFDGNSGSGKTSLARYLARHYDAVFFSSGILYRGVGVHANSKKVELGNEHAVELYMGTHTFEFYINEKSEVEFMVNQEVVSDLYSPEASECASMVAQYPAVRSALLEMQQGLVEKCCSLKGSDYVLVAEGRDLGTVVYPEARLKFFVRVDEETRLQRRQQQMKKELSSEETRKEIIERDQRDTSRSVAPTKAAEDAILIENAGSFEEAARQVLACAERRLESKGN